MGTDSLTLWTVYAHPRDFPRHIVVRRFVVMRGRPEPLMAFTGCLYDTLFAARRDCRRNGATVRLVRWEHDDPFIVETWVQ
jgi:hypothetical protein